MLHSNPWEYVRLDAGTGALVRMPNLCPTPQSLYLLCEEDFLVGTFRDDLIVRLHVGRTVGSFSFLEDHRQVAETLGVPLDLQTPEAARRSCEAFYDSYAFTATLLLLEELRDYLGQRGKKALLMLSYPGNVIAGACRGERRRDGPFIEALPTCGLPFVDALAAHRADYESFSSSPEQYVTRYFNGHYSPVGNQFFAFAVKDALVRWLDPPPMAYADNGPWLGFEASVKVGDR
jgi:hypothetical protein